MLFITVIAIFSVLLFAGTFRSDSRSGTRRTVADFDAERFMGTWYEIARFDHRFERGLTRVSAQYTLMPDGRIKVVNRGYNTRRGKYREIEGRARLTAQTGRLQVSFFLWFYSDYNILALGDDYAWALIGSRSDKFLWIMSRTPTLPDKTFARITAMAREHGYDPSHLLIIAPRQ